jgi:putative drug exporter of the RND superfamily
VLERWAIVMAHRRNWVIACWAAVVVVGLFSAQRLPGLLSTSLAVPGTGSQQANSVLARDFGQNVEGTFTVVVLSREAAAEPVAALGKDLARAAHVVPRSEVSPVLRGVGALYASIASPSGLQRSAYYTSALREALARQGLTRAYVTGAPALQHDLAPVLQNDLQKGEVIGIAVALVLLCGALGFAPAVLLPFLVALCTTSGALAIIYLLAHEFLMALYVPNLVDLIGLGLAVDYSLLVVHRFKDELADDTKSVEAAIARTMATAGRTVILSGAAVAIGMAVLVIVPVPFVESLGVAGLLVPLVSIASALTLQPAALSLLGRRGTSALVPLARRPGRGVAEGLWAHAARAVTGRPWAMLAAAVAVMAALAAPIAWLKLTPASVTAVPHGTGSVRGLDILRQRAGSGVATPLEIVVDSGKGGAANKGAVAAATLRLADKLVSQPDVYVVAMGTRRPYIDRLKRYGRLVVVERDDFGDIASQQLVHRTRSVLVPEAHFPPSTRVYVGGAPAQGVDFLARVYGTFPWVVLVVGGLVYLLLLRAFRSLLLPLLAALLDALSVTAACGLVVLAFRFGGGAGTLGLYKVAQTEGWVPIFLFVALFGISMDYEMFLVTRMRESHDAGAANVAAIVDGIAHTGRVVSVAALIMAGALAGLVAGRVAGLQELGVGLALGVLLDATVVRCLLMPSLMTLLGSWNWWLPPTVARVLGVKSPSARSTAPGPGGTSAGSALSQPYPQGPVGGLPGDFDP